MTEREFAAAERVVERAIKTVCKARGISLLDWATEYLSRLGIVVCDRALAERVEDIAERLDGGDFIGVGEITEILDAFRSLPGWHQHQARVLH